MKAFVCVIWTHFEGERHRKRAGHGVQRTRGGGRNHFYYWFSEGNTSGNGPDFSLRFAARMARSVTILRTLNCYWTVSWTFGEGMRRMICDKNTDSDFVVPLRFIILYYIILIYTGCPRRNVRDFRRVFLMLNYTDITQNTYIQS